MIKQPEKMDYGDQLKCEMLILIDKGRGCSSREIIGHMKTFFGLTEPEADRLIRTFENNRKAGKAALKGEQTR